MGWESLLKPAKYLDEQVLREYTKVAKKWEDGGRNIYHLSSAFGFPSKILIVGGVDTLFFPRVGLLIDMAIYNWDFIYNYVGLKGNLIEEKETNREKCINPEMDFFKQINRTVRLPTLVAGVSLIGKSTYDFYNYFAHGEPIEKDTLGAFTLGMGLVGIASSQYLKDRNPKLLKKDPAWKTISNFVKEKLSVLPPEPVPSPQTALVEN